MWFSFGCLEQIPPLTICWLSKWSGIIIKANIQNLSFQTKVTFYAVSLKVTTSSMLFFFMGGSELRWLLVQDTPTVFCSNDRSKSDRRAAVINNHHINSTVLHDYWLVTGSTSAVRAHDSHPPDTRTHSIGKRSCQLATAEKITDNWQVFVGAMETEDETGKKKISAAVTMMADIMMMAIVCKLVWVPAHFSPHRQIPVLAPVCQCVSPHVYGSCETLICDSRRLLP